LIKGNLYMAIQAHKKLDNTTLDVYYGLVRYG